MIYENSVADVGAVHGRPLEHYDFVEEVGVSGSVRNESAYTDWMVSTPDRNPQYIQTLGTVPEPDRYPRRVAYMRRLLDGDHFGYTVAVEFGHRPRERSRVRRLMRAGIVPRIEKRRPYIVVLAREQSP